jgi:hypothetical protein
MLQRLISKISVDAETGCWLWTATKSIGGYGRFYEGGSHGRTLSAHRAAYELLVGPIPEGMTLDHVRERGCVHRHCVNPKHLEPVTLRENLMRGDTPAAINAAKTKCIHGHDFTVENTYVYADGRRTCRTCIRDRSRERMREARKQKRKAA